MRAPTHRTTTLLAATLLVVTACLTSSCSSARYVNAQECALIGGGLGTAAGIGYGVIDDNINGGEIAATAGIGLVIGAAAGYTWCVLTDRSG